MKPFRYLLLASVLLSGCAATHTLPSTELRYGESYLPPIHVMSNDPLKGNGEMIWEHTVLLLADGAARLAAGIAAPLLST